MRTGVLRSSGCGFASVPLDASAFSPASDEGAPWASTSSPTFDARGWLRRDRARPIDAVIAMALAYWRVVREQPSVSGERGLIMLAAMRTLVARWQPSAAAAVSPHGTSRARRASRPRRRGGPLPRASSAPALAAWLADQWLPTGSK
jgi:hypothetical protein